MAWDGWPPSSGVTDISAYDWLIQIWKALRERACILGSVHFPRENVIFESGLVGNVIGTSGIHDSTKVWGFGVNCSGTSRWFNYVCPESTATPRFYDIYFDVGGHDDPYRVVKSEITGNDESNIYFNRIDNYITAGYLTNESDLINKSYYIIKRGGVSWKDRWPDIPNSQELTKGVIDDVIHDPSGHIPSGEGWLGIIDQDRSWKRDKFKDKQLLVYDNQNLLRRLDIKANTRQAIFYPSGDFTIEATAAYMVVEPGGSGFPDHQAGLPFMWYGGLSNAYWAHETNDTLGSTKLPATSKTWSEGSINADEITCEDVTHEAFDQDLWTEFGDPCPDEGADFNFTPDLYKTIRGIQNHVVGISHNFVDPTINYNGKKYINQFTVANFFKTANINYRTSSITNLIVGSGVTISPVETPYLPVTPTYYTVMDPDGQILADGIGSLDASGMLSDAGVFAIPELSGVIGQSIVLAFGWTRYYPREFKYLYDKTVFIPDVDSGDGGIGVVDPPRQVDPSGCFGVGSWITRGKSTNYRESDGLGFVSEGGPAFKQGDLARYNGDNWNDPFAGIETEISGPQPQDLPYWDRFYRGKHPPSKQKALERDCIGVATGGNDYSLTDNRKNWWTNWYAGGELVVHSGSVTHGDSTFIEDENQVGNCFWDDTTGRFEDFILEIYNVSGTLTKVPITGMDKDLGRLTFDTIPGFSVNVGDTYKIREPKYELNRFKDRYLRVYPHSESGTYRETKILYNDDITLFFDPAADIVVTSGTRYKILDYYPGGVWKWDNDTRLPSGITQTLTWIIPSGTDDRGDVQFQPDPRNNLPTRVTRYGPMIKGDYINITVFEELYRAINLLRWTPHDYTWTSRGEINKSVFQCNTGQDSYTWPGVEGANHVYDTYDDAWAAFLNDNFACWQNIGGNHLFDAGDSPPTSNLRNESRDVSNEVNGFDVTPCSVGNVETSAIADDIYAYASGTGFVTCMKSAVDFYAYSTIDAEDHDEGTSVEITQLETMPYIISGSLYTESRFNGDGFNLLFREWSLIDALPPSYDISRSSDVKIGKDLSESYPEWKQPANPLNLSLGCGDSGPPYEYATCILQHGFYIKDYKAIVRWNVSGGLKYVDVVE